MFVLDLDESLPADNDGSAWLYTAQNTAYYARLGLNASIGIGVKYGTSNLGRMGLRGAQDAPLRYVVDVLGRIGLIGVSTFGVRYQTIVNGRIGLQADSQELSHTTLALVGRVGFNAANFGGSSLSTVYPIWCFPEPPTFQADSGDDLIVEIDDQLIVEDIGAGHFGVNLFGTLGARGATGDAARYGISETAQAGLKGAQVNVFHGRTDLAARLGLNGLLRLSLRGEEIAYLGARGVITVNARYAADLTARLGAQGFTEEQIHWAIIESGQLGLIGATTELYGHGVDLVGLLGARGAIDAVLPPGFEVLGRILTADGTPMYLVRLERRP